MYDLQTFSPSITSYSYVEARPISFIDPDGLILKEAWDAYGLLGTAKEGGEILYGGEKLSGNQTKIDKLVDEYGIDSEAIE